MEENNKSSKTNPITKAILIALSIIVVAGAVFVGVLSVDKIMREMDGKNNTVHLGDCSRGPC